MKVYQKITEFFLLCWVVFFIQQLISHGSWIFNKTEDQVVWLVLLTVLYVPGRIYKSIKRLPFTSYDYKWIGGFLVFIISTKLWLWYEDFGKVPYAIGSKHGSYVEIDDILAFEDASYQRVTLHLVNGSKVEIKDPYFVSDKYPRSRFHESKLRSLLKE